MELKEEIKCKLAPDIIAISEIKPKNYKRELQENEYSITGYKFEHTTLEKDNTRGIGIYVKDTLKYSLINPLKIITKNDEIPKEIICLEIQLAGKEKMLVCNVYRSPCADITENININKFVKKFGFLNYKHKVVFGDFNRKYIDWNTMSATSEDDMNFIEACRDGFLFQHIQTATRARGSDEPSLLDLFFSTNEDALEEINIDSPLGKSDHSLIKIKYRSQKDYATKKTINNYGKADFEKMKEHLDIDWGKLLSNYGDDLDGMWDMFVNKYKDAELDCIPKKEVKNDIRKFSCNLDRSGSAKRKRKQRLWKRYMENKDPQIYLEYCKCRNQVRRLTRNIIKEHEKKVAKFSKTNSKLFWKYVNGKTKLKESVPNLFTSKKTDPNKMTENNIEKAELLGKYFSDVFVKEPDWTWNLTQEKERIPKEHKFDLSLNREIIAKKLAKLNINKSPGPDVIHPRVLKEMSSVVVEPLYIIFKKSIDLGKIPSAWKLASVTPIYKNKGSKHIPNNYRPISITSIACRTMESIIKDSMMKYLTTNNILSNKQFGFLSGRSTVLQLLTVLDKWTEVLNKGNAVDVIFCDFQKAFDTVPHKRLIEVLLHYGINDPLLSWITDFLNGRKMEVNVSGHKSGLFDVTSGVPQGSVLGPILFILYINILIEKSETSNIYLYADDLKLFREVSSVCDMEKLQNTLERMYDWTCYSLLRFHPDKCNTMRITSSRGDNNLVDGCYSMDEMKLNTVEIEKDLGVYIDNKLTFEYHINMKVKKANSMFGMIRRSFTYMDRTVFKQLFISIVRPHLEYAAPVWNPHLKKLIVLIENVQRRATKTVPGLHLLGYKDRLKALKLPTLEYRRYRGDMIELYKLTHGIYDVNIELLNFRNNERNENASTAHKFSLCKEKSGKDIRRFYFKNRVTDQWNNLPYTIVDAPSLNTFKNRLDKIWTINDVMFDNNIDLYKTTSSRRTRYLMS